MDIAAVRTTTRESTLIIELSRHEKRNAINAAMAHGIEGALDAARAERLGLVNLLTAAGEAPDGAIALAQRIGENSPVAVRETLRLIADAVVGRIHLDLDESGEDEGAVRTQTRTWPEDADARGFGSHG